MKCFLKIMALLLFCASYCAVNAQSVPPLINYQGQLMGANGQPLPTADYELRFSIYDAVSGGNPIWGPQVFNGQSGPGYGPKIPIVQGYFNVMLGPVDINGISLLNAFNGTNRFVEITISNRPPIAPRQQILSAPFALKAENSAKLAGYDWTSLFGTNDPVNGKLSGGRIATGTIGQDQVADRAIQERHLGALPRLQTTISNLTLHVSTNGNDLNDGFTLATAKRTIQAAVDLVPNTILHQVTIQIEPGTYSEQVVILQKQVPSHLAGANFRLLGVANNPGAVIISGSDRPNCLFISGSHVSVEYVTFQNAWTGVYCYRSSQFSMTGCNFYDQLSSGLICAEHSGGSLEDCVIEQRGERRGGGLLVEQHSFVTLRDDHHELPGINTFKNLSLALSAQTGAIINVPQPISLIGNTTVKEETLGGAIYGTGL